MSKQISFPFLSVLFLAQSTLAQDLWEVPRTDYGVPDLQGVRTSASITTLERESALGNTLIVDAEEARQIEQNAALNVLTEADNCSQRP